MLSLSYIIRRKTTRDIRLTIVKAQLRIPSFEMQYLKIESLCWFMSYLSLDYDSDKQEEVDEVQSMKNDVDHI